MNYPTAKQPYLMRPRFQLGRTQALLPLLLKIVFLGLVVALAALFVPSFIAVGEWVMALGVGLVALVILAIYTTKRAIPAKYLFPGSLFLVVFLVVPILLTAHLSTTNFGDGTRGAKDDTIASLIAQSVQPTTDSPKYTVSYATEGNATEGPFVLFLVDDASDEVLRVAADGVQSISWQQLDVEDGKVTSANDAEILNAGETNAASAEFAEFDPEMPGGGKLVLQGLGSAFVGEPTLTYDDAADTITDLSTGAVYTPERIGDRDYFVDEDGNKLSDRSWTSNVGLDNFSRIFGDPGVRSSLLSAFVWTLFFATFSVGGTFLLGLLVAVVFNHPKMRFQKLQRSLLVIPYAMPTFIGFLVWSTFFNKDFGFVNQSLGLDISWLGDPFWAKVAVCIANLWAGFPYMFLISTGALQSLPEDIGEAAALDGAGPFQAFARIKFPLLLIAVAPLLVASFAFNFNNYNAIALMTEGGPFKADGSPFGATDILISGVFRIAFGGQGEELGFAAALSVLLFIVTAVMAVTQFRYTRVLEDVQ